MVQTRAESGVIGWNRDRNRENHIKDDSFTPLWYNMSYVVIGEPEQSPGV